MMTTPRIQNLSITDLDSDALGIQDVPITSPSQDALGIKGYAEALTKFVLKCKTPMTIAIQGDWGSGKTSLMQLIRASLTDQVIPIEFNTWQFSQLNMATDLPILMIGHFTEEVGKNLREEETVKRMKNTVKSAWRWAETTGAAAIYAGAKALGGDAAAKAAEQILPATDPLEVLRTAKDDLSKMVDMRRKKERDKRIVVFIDDLDRLVPVKALELLEVMKVFLDLEGCVFLLACDFEVIKIRNKGEVQDSIFGVLREVFFRQDFPAFISHAYGWVQN